MPTPSGHLEFATGAVDYNVNGTLRVKPPFGYYGAKHRIAHRIVAILPPHYAWVEAFCGSAAITLAKPAAPIEVINDKNGEVVNLFEQLRNNRDSLCSAVTLTPYARTEFCEARKPVEGLSALERARRFLIIAMMTVNGTGSQCGFSFSSSFVRGGKEARVNRWYNLPGRLADVAERLRHVRVENRDARELLEMFLNRPATLVYLDPPYFINRKHEYVTDANDQTFHEDLLRLCCKAKCMILLSGYDTTMYNEMLMSHSGWQRSVIETHTKDTTGKHHPRTEVLWQNKYFVKASETGKVPIRLTKAEKAENKVNPERL